MPSYSFLGVSLYIPDLDEIINAVTGPITRYVSDSVYSLQVTMTPLFRGIETSLGVVVSSVINEVTVFFKDPLNYVQVKLDGVGIELSALGPQIAGAFESTRSSLGSLGNSIVTDLGARVHGIELTLSGAVEGLGPVFLGALDAANVTLSAAFEGGLNIVGTTIGGLFTGFGSVDTDQLSTVTSSIAGTLEGTLAAVGLRFSPLTLEQARDWVNDFLPQVNAAYMTLFTTNMIVEAVSLGQVDFAPQASYRLPSTAAAIELATEFSAMPVREGLGPIFKRHILKSYTPYLPSYADMIDVYVKEGYLPEKWVEIPPEFVANMTELGYSMFWTNRLWGKHWVLPELGQLFDMYHRTLGTRPEIGVGLELVRKMLKFKDYEPIWRDRLEAITWRTWRIFDLRTAWEMNILSDEELIAKSIDTGYSPEEAPLVAETQKMFVYRSEIERLLSEADADFIDGWITEAQLRVNYDATPFREVLKEMRVARAKLRRDRDAKKEIAAALKERAIKLDLSIAEYGQELSRLGMIEDWILIEQEKVKARLLKKPAAA